MFGGWDWGIKGTQQEPLQAVSKAKKKFFSEKKIRTWRSEKSRTKSPTEHPESNMHFFPVRLLRNNQYTGTIFHRDYKPSVRRLAGDIKGRKIKKY